MNSTKPVILFDMDGTTYDFQTPLAKLIQETTTLPLAFREKMADTANWTKIALWKLFDGTKEEQDEIKAIIEPLYQTREFFASLEPYPGMVETIHSLEDDFDIHFCTKPSVKQCDSE
jgi:beta-phosphoglucomutase-like phosphatase (HAD superfamily)